MKINSMKRERGMRRKIIRAGSGKRGWNNKTRDQNLRYMGGK